LSIDSVLILGVGNTLLSDEGLGVHLVNKMQSLYGEHESIEYLDGGTLSFTLAEPIARADGLIIVDAARLHSPPGSVKVFQGEAMHRYLSGNRQSVHEVSLIDLLDIAMLTESLPQAVFLVGIEPYSLEWGEQPSEPVAAGMHQAIGEIIKILRDWGIQMPESRAVG